MVHKQNIQLGNTKSLSFFAKVGIFVTAAVVVASIAYFIDKPTSDVDTQLITKTQLQDPITNTEEVLAIDNDFIEQETEKNNETTSKSNTDSKVEEIKQSINDEDFTIDTVDNISEVNTDIKEDNIPILAREEADETETIEQNYIDDNHPSFEEVKEAQIEAPYEEKNLLDTFKVKYGRNPIICFGEDAILVIEKGLRYDWNTGDINNKIIVTPLESSSYFVTVTNENGQTNVHEFKVEVDNSCSALFIPSAFTPNADGQNDAFKAEGRGIESMQMVVLNKMGQVLFEASHISQSWDGKYNGDLLPPDTYFYQVNYIDAKGNSHIKRGQITLIR